MKKIYGILPLTLIILTISSFALVPQRKEIHCKHFLFGYPYGAPESNDMIIRDPYALSSNDDTKFADWVAYRVDKYSMDGPSRTRNWKADPWLDETETLEPDDYDGAYNTLNTDRGHMAPLGSFDGSPEWFTTNYLSNIMPQSSSLNRGMWKSIEDTERKLVDTFNFVFVITGPLYDDEMPAMPGADEPHQVPGGFWKIVMVPAGNVLLTAAFIFYQDGIGGNNISDHAVNINDIERRTGLDFLWELEDSLEEEIEANENKDWIITNFD